MPQSSIQPRLIERTPPYWAGFTCVYRLLRAMLAWLILMAAASVIGAGSITVNRDQPIELELLPPEKEVR